MKDGYLRFYVLLNSICDISGRWKTDNERLCAMEPCLRFKTLLPPGTEYVPISGPDKKGNRDNLGIISHFSPSKHIL